MKITKIEIEKINIPLITTFKVAFAEVSASTSVIVKIHTDDGIVGYGEAAPFEPVTGESADSVILALKYFQQALIGMDATDLEGIHLQMDKLLIHNTSAKCAIDIALYDIKGKKMKMPLYKLLGGSNPTVINDITIGIDTPENMAKKAYDYVNMGYRILKIKIGINPKDDLSAIKSIRDKVGYDIKLRLDANQGYSISTAIQFIEDVKKYKIDAIEQFLPHWNIEGSATIRKNSQGIRIMLDESIHSPYDAARSAKIDAADVFNIKLMKCGGLFNAEKINSIAEGFGINCMVGCMLETKIAITAGISLVASKNNIIDADCDSFMYAKDPNMNMTGGFTFEKDIFTLSENPGLGINLDW
ncbi:hypothetical protein HMPREF9630_01860 [Peptoanaerobacter stomatis]|uniref:Dipeptide epimerase n=1 Tax=Peptoanaerobacter stomatis TaxID=796937 RepID=V9HK71_9FIRM|nr:dipeptide epimerase [Peptoanaerobacter stomatis]EHL16661.1 hypothetical protein HMPREF9630_01860 [Peptoanaerobacter stomatis]